MARAATGPDFALDGDGPLYRQIKRAIAGAVTGGQLRPGERVPPETDLMARFGASRMTVHKAISQLAAEGLLTRNKRAGTVVAPGGRERAIFEIWDASAEAARAGLPYRFDVVGRETRPARPRDRDAMDAAAGTPLFAIVGRHLAGGIAVQVEERLVNVAAAPGIRDADFAATPPGRWLLEHVTWTQAEHAIGAVAAPVRIARLLSIEPGAAALVVERKTWNGARQVTFARLWHPGTARVLVGRFAPGPR